MCGGCYINMYVRMHAITYYFSLDMHFLSGRFLGFVFFSSIISRSFW